MNNHDRNIETTADIPPNYDPFDTIVGQEEAIKLVRAAVQQRRHVLLCGVPGIGKSLIAKAAATLLPSPTHEIRVHANPDNKERPIVQMNSVRPNTSIEKPEIIESRFVRPENVSFEIAIRMGFRCPRCGAFSSPSVSQCIECGSVKRATSVGTESYQGLFRKLDVMLESAETEIVDYLEHKPGYSIEYVLSNDGTIEVTLRRESEDVFVDNHNNDQSLLLVSQNSSRFVRVSGSSPAELLGDIKHDPYGSAEELGKPAHLRVVPGAIHEAHEGILYIDEIGALGGLQKHLLTAMQEKRFAISGHNPNSSGAAVRVDDVPCDFILFAACNLDDVNNILPPLRSRIRGYGYEILLSSWMENSTFNRDATVRFIAQTVYDDGRIPHFTQSAVHEVLEFSETMAFELDGQKDALTLRLRELGGLIRISGDLAVNEDSEYVEQNHVVTAQELSKGISSPSLGTLVEKQSKSNESYGDYFF